MRKPRSIATGIAMVGFLLLVATSQGVAVEPRAGSDTVRRPPAMTSTSVDVADVRCDGTWARALPGGSVCFEPIGDILKICDQYGDGWHVAAEVKYKGDYTRYHSRYGAGQCDVRNWDLDEWEDIDYQAEIWNQDDWLYQGNWVDSDTTTGA
jgi:hypothetical protein